MAPPRAGAVVRVKALVREIVTSLVEQLSILLGVLCLSQPPLSKWSELVVVVVVVVVAGGYANGRKMTPTGSTKGSQVNLETQILVFRTT